MDLMEWALFSLQYLSKSWKAKHEDFNDLMGEIREYSHARRTFWYSPVKGMIQTLYHYSQEFAESTEIPSERYPSPDIFKERLGGYRIFVEGIASQAEALISRYEEENRTTGGPFLVEQAERMARYFLNAIEYVLSKLPSFENAKSKTTNHTILLVHGIRDHGTWQTMVADVLEKDTSCKVVPISYQYFDIVRFALPLPWRQRPIRIVQQELLHQKSKNPDTPVSVIAHSYGTFAVTEALEQNRDLEINHLVLCGAIVRSSYDWGATRRQITGYIVNDYSFRDPWPVLAKSTTWGFGATGTYGFRSGRIDKDRDHHLCHSGFFRQAFVEKYWKPIFVSGEIVAPDRTTTGYGKAPWYFWFLGLPLKYILIGVLLVFLARRFLL